MAFLEFEIPVRSWSNTEREILVARLSLIGFDGFVENDYLLQAYIKQEDFSGDSLGLLVEEFDKQGMHIQYRYHETPDQNWNEEWEKNFSPVFIQDKVLIRAPFHDNSSDLPLTVVIEPKMSFGTGHHFTTRLMVEAMLTLDLKDKRVLDMGCGTGVLGIIACLQGAKSVLGIDNDQWAYENALENVERNAAGNMQVRLGDSQTLGDEEFDVVLANITRNILVRDIAVYSDHLVNQGHLVLSGILSEDVQYVLNAAYHSQLDHRTTCEDSSWISLSFVKSDFQTVRP